MKEDKKNIYEKLLNIQIELKAPKGQYNSFGGYKYRSCENILEAVKPLCNKYKCLLVLSDEMIILGDNNPTLLNYEEYDKIAKKVLNKQKIVATQRYYIKATATLCDLESVSVISNTAYAREEEEKKGMDGSQITGTSSSYARKYALNGLFAIDDNKDSDDTNKPKSTEKDRLELLSKVQVKAVEAEVDLDIIAAVYQKKTINNLSTSQLEQVLRKLEKTTEETKVKENKEKEKVF